MMTRFDKGTKKDCPTCQKLLGEYIFAKRGSQSKNDVFAAHSLGDLQARRVELAEHKKVHEA